MKRHATEPGSHRTITKFQLYRSDLPTGGLVMSPLDELRVLAMGQIPDRHCG